MLLIAIGVGLSTHPDQPIVENYVGRQIPTAMVARNLDRGSGFLHPMLDTAPFPNEFLVEPPIYAQLVAWVKTGIGFVWSGDDTEPIGFVWEIAGRLTSAAVTTLGAWAFFGLVRRREGPVVALIAVGSFGIMPVTLRYGRAFQPDAAMLGFVLLGLRGWDEYQATGRRHWATLGGIALTVGLAIKVTALWALIPFFVMTTRLTAARRIGLGGAMLLPALAWYGHAWNELQPSPAMAGSLAAADNAAIWAGSFAPTNWVRWATWEAIGRNLLVRAFTPLGLVLALTGASWRGATSEGDRFWRGWVVGIGGSIVALATKWHHGYYWLVLAPAVALGVARGLVALGSASPRRRGLAVGLGLLFVGSSLYQARSTWRTPPEWLALGRAADQFRSIRGTIGMPIAPEALLYYADVPGSRLEFSPAAICRAAGEAGVVIGLDEATRNPLALVECYLTHVANSGLTDGYRLKDWATEPGCVADVGPVVDDPRRAAFRAALRRRPRTEILIDEPDFILARLR